MPIKKSNILAADRILHIGKGDSIHPEAMAMQADAIRKKSYDLLNDGDQGREMVQLIRGKNAQSLLMQQVFEDKSAICVLVSPDGEVTSFSAEGAASETTREALSEKFWQAWADVTLERTDDYKIALVLSAAAYQEYAENRMAEKPDARFTTALSAVCNKMQLVGA